MNKGSAEAISCGLCSNLFHLACVGFTDSPAKASTWTCPECKAKIPRKNNDDTPVKCTSERVVASCVREQSVCMSPSDSAHEATSEYSLADEFKLLREVFREELSGLRSEMQEIRRELSKVSSSLLLCNERIDGLDLRVSSVEKHCNERLKEFDSRLTVMEKHALEQTHSDPTSTEVAIAQLRAELNDRDQELLLNDLDITGISEEKSESVIHIATLVAAKLGVKLDESDIVRAERVGPIRGGREEVSTRPIVVRLARRALRDDIIRAARVRRAATTADMNLPGPERRFYVNERLTKYNRQLFNSARVAAKKCKYKFVWSRDGKIYVRKSEGQPGFRVRNEQDIKRIFSTENV